MDIKIDLLKYTGYGSCVELCSFKAISIEDTVMKKKTGRKRGN
jgi:heterodisulfide reductase subunit A-like polyferredoxin